MFSKYCNLSEFLTLTSLFKALDPDWLTAAARLILSADWMILTSNPHNWLERTNLDRANQNGAQL